jgi:hypothetical protein
LIGDEVNATKVHRLVTSIEADVAFFGLAGVAWHQLFKTF